MGKFVAWVDDGKCLDESCQSEAKKGRFWDTRAIYCSDECFLDDGHKLDRHRYRRAGETYDDDYHDDSHWNLGSHKFPLEPDTCDRCAGCEKKLIQGNYCEFECDDECKEIWSRKRGDA